MMNRRRFFKTLASGLVIAVTPTIFLSPRGGWIQSAHSDYLINIDWMLKQCWDAYRIQPDHIIVSNEFLKSQGFDPHISGIDL